MYTIYPVLGRLEVISSSVRLIIGIRRQSLKISAKMMSSYTAINDRKEN